MKIGVDIRCLMESRYSGISEYTVNLLTQLFKLDLKNQYFLFYNAGKPAKLPAFNFPNVTLKGYAFPNKLFNLALRFLKITAVDRLIGGVDVFLVPNLLFINLSAQCKKILIIHDLSFELYPEFFTFKSRLWHKLIGPKRMCRQADAIIAVSENTKNDIVRYYGIAPEKIKVVYPGISDIFFQPVTAEQRAAVKKKYDLPEEYIFYLGNLEPRKNVETLISAFARVPSERLQLIIAGGQAWKFKKIYRLWQASAAKDRIKFLGYVDAADKPALYAAAKIFVYPSIYEGFGLPPVEAMASGCPVITSANSSLVEAVGEAGLLVDPNNISELAEIIRQLLADSQLRASLAAKGLEHAKQFNWEEAARNILAVFSSKNN